jgi:hypothetical protein
VRGLLAKMTVGRAYFVTISCNFLIALHATMAVATLEEARPVHEPQIRLGQVYVGLERRGRLGRRRIHILAGR